MIRAANLVGMRGGQRIIDRVDIDAAASELTVVFGPSGAGKTTLLRLLAGLDRPAAGTVEAPDVAMVFQDLGLWPHLTALRQVQIVLRSNGGDPTEAPQWLERWGLAQRAAAYPHELSGGEAQRLAIARTMAASPRNLLLDEPLANLDRPAREILFEKIRALPDADRAVIYVTHDRDEALAADRLVILIDGRVAQSGVPDAIYRAPASLQLARLLGPAAALSGRREGDVLHTSLGALKVNGPGQIAILRPEQLILRPGTGARVLDRRSLGRTWRLTISFDGQRLLVDSPEAEGDAFDLQVTEAVAAVPH